MTYPTTNQTRSGYPKSSAKPNIDRTGRSTGEGLEHGDQYNTAGGKDSNPEARPPAAQEEETQKGYRKDSRSAKSGVTDVSAGKRRDLGRQ